MVSQAQNNRDTKLVHRDDLNLARRAVDGEPEALKQLMFRLRTVPRTLAYRNHKLGRPLGVGELEDLAQEVLGSIWSKLKDYSGQGPLEAWAYRFCYLSLLSRLRKLRRLPTLFADAGDRAEEPVAPEVVDSLDYEHIHEGLEKIPVQESEVIRLKHLEGRTFDDIAAGLEVSKNTAKTRYYRGLIKLRQILKARFKSEEQSS